MSERTREDSGPRHAREKTGSSRVRSDTGVTGKSRTLRKTGHTPKSTERVTGFDVLRPPVTIVRPDGPPRFPTRVPPPFSAKALRTKEQPISYLINTALRNPGLINLAAGLVDPLTLPVQECEAITRRLFSDKALGRKALQYEHHAGTDRTPKRSAGACGETRGNSGIGDGPLA